MRLRAGVLALAAAVGVAAAASAEGRKMRPAPWTDGEALWFVSRRPEPRTTPTPTPTPRPSPSGSVTLPPIVSSSPPLSQSGAMVTVREANGNWSLRAYTVTATMFTGNMMSPTSGLRTIEVEPEAFAPVAFLQRDGMGGEVRARYGNGRVEVTSTRSGVRTYELEDGALEQAELPFLVRCLPLAEGYSTTVPVFAGGIGVYPVRISVAARETVTVPAGRFDAFKLQVEGGPNPRAYWISTDDHRYLVREEDDSRITELVRVGQWDAPTPLAHRDGKWNVSLTPPAGWISQPPRRETDWSIGWGVMAADGAVQCNCRFEDFLLLLEERPASPPPGWRPEKPRALVERDMKARARLFPALAVRPDSWTETAVDGVTTVRYVADFSPPRGTGEMVEYGSYSTQPLRAMIACYVPKGAFAQRKPELDALMDSLRLR